jgi:hypothetical protein
MVYHNMQLKSFEFKNFKFTPLETVYRVKSSKQAFILYKLEHNNIKSYIPYYISDAKTNKFDTNLIFPFMCIGTYSGKYNSENIYDGCMRLSDRYTPPVVFKYKLCKNINIEKLNY